MGPLATPRLHMQTLFRFNGEGLIVGTREPDAVHGPVYWIARGRDGCVWAVRHDTPRRLRRELEVLAEEERPSRHTNISSHTTMGHVAHGLGVTRGGLVQSSGGRTPSRAKPHERHANAPRPGRRCAKVALSCVRPSVCVSGGNALARTGVRVPPPFRRRRRRGRRGARPTDVRPRHDHAVVRPRRRVREDAAAA